MTIGVRELGGDIVEIPADVMHAGSRTDQRRRAQPGALGRMPSSSARSPRIGLQQIAEITPKLHIINALSNESIPCQALADMQTLHEKWARSAGRRIAYVGDGNNVCTSLVHAAMMLGRPCARRDAEGLRAAGRSRRSGRGSLAEGRRPDRVHRSESRGP
jgi:ornithine carbamoyltransferase